MSTRWLTIIALLGALVVALLFAQMMAQRDTQPRPANAAPAATAP